MITDQAKNAFSYAHKDIKTGELQSIQSNGLLKAKVQR
jgi:hypothetical protein